MRTENAVIDLDLESISDGALEALEGPADVGYEVRGCRGLRVGGDEATGA